MTNEGPRVRTEIITQGELDALLTSIEVAGRRRRPASEAATAALYDFRYASKLSPDHMRMLQARLAILTGALNRTMSLYLNNHAHFHVHSLDVTSYEQYLRNLAANPILGVITLGGGTSMALWEMSAPLAAMALACMLGGNASEEQFGEPTPIERAILRRFFQEVLSAWSELWDRLKALRPHVEAVVASAAEIDPRASDERLFSAMLECTIAGTRGMMRLCLPLSVVKRLLRDERETVTAADVEAHADVRNPADHLPTCGPLSATPVVVTACLEPPPLPVSELLQLQPGAVINLRLPANEPFTLNVAAMPKFRARAGTANGRLAVRVVAGDEPPEEACDPPQPPE
jgi:flagellar motor switch protein FliM